MREGTMRRAMLIIAAAILLAGCGGGQDPTKAAPSNSTSTPSFEPTKTEPTVDPQELADFQQCKREETPLLEALQNVDSRLDVGLTNADYGTALGDAAVAYNRIPFRRLSFGCLLGVGQRLEDAYNQYLKAKDSWDNCIDDLYCDVDREALPEMRRRWSQASHLIAKAQRSLQRSDPR